MSGRTYFADTCTNGSYSRERYVSLKLLGKKFTYTTDVSSAGCGCNAALYLAAMPQNDRPSECSDYYCDANSVCGVQCAEIDLQEANRHAFRSTLHAAADKSGVAEGFGGGVDWNGPRDWKASQYAPGSDCIDTAKPFNVEVAFPMTETGELRSMDTTLSQRGRSCRLHGLVDAARYEGAGEVSRALAAGMTPVISYWRSSNMLWLDGKGRDGKGECAQDHPKMCGEGVRFFNFAVENLDGSVVEVVDGPPFARETTPSPSPASQDAPHAPPAPSPGEGKVTVQDELDSIARIFDYATEIEKEEGIEKREKAREEQEEEHSGLATTPPGWNEPVAREGPRGTTFATKKYKFVGFATASDARRACGDRWRLAMPKAPEDWSAVSTAVAQAMQEDGLSTTWPYNHVWLAGQWSLSNVRWLWDDRSFIDPAVLSTRWAPGSPSGATTQAEKPWLCMNTQGQVRDVDSSVKLGIICESAAAPVPAEAAPPSAPPLLTPAAAAVGAAVGAAPPSSLGLGGPAPLGAPQAGPAQPDVRSASFDNAAYDVVMQKQDVHRRGAPRESSWGGLGSLPLAIGVGITSVAMLSVGLVVASRRLPPQLAGTLRAERQRAEQHRQQRFALQGQLSQLCGRFSTSSYRRPSDLLNDEELA